DKILDLVLSNDPMIVSDLLLDLPFCSSDHNSLSIYIFTNYCSISGVAKEEIFILDWVRADWNLYASLIKCVNWSNVFDSCVCSNDLWNIFKNVLNECNSKAVPYKRVLASDKSNLAADSVTHYPRHIVNL